MPFHEQESDVRGSVIAAPSRLRAFVATVVGLSLVALSLLRAPSPRIETDLPRPAFRPAPDLGPLKLIEWDGLSLSSSDSRGDYEIRASEADYRKRQGASGWITYHDLAELSLSDVRFGLALRAHEGFSSIPATVSALLPRVEGDDPLSGASSPRSGTELDRLPPITRLVFEQVEITLDTPRTQVTLHALSGRYDIFGGTLLLEGSFRLEAPDGEVLEAPRAVLSRDRPGLYLPAGQVVEGRHDPRSFFAVLDEAGRLSRTTGAKPMPYADLIESRERLVLMHYAEHAPQALRPLIAAMLAGLRGAGR